MTQSIDRMTLELKVIDSQDTILSMRGWAASLYESLDICLQKYPHAMISVCKIIDEGSINEHRKLIESLTRAEIIELLQLQSNQYGTPSAFFSLARLDPDNKLGLQKPE